MVFGFLAPLGQVDTYINYIYRVGLVFAVCAGMRWPYTALPSMTVFAKMPYSMAESGFSAPSG